MLPNPSLSKPVTVIPWRAQTGPQLTAIQHDTIDELLYGGAVFGGKSDFLLGDFAQDVPRDYGRYWHGILFRKTYKQLEELISRSKDIYPPWFPGAKWSNSDVMWSWPNGATLKMRHMDSDDDWLEYWGHSYTWMGWDELGNWASSIPYLRMKARLRCAQHPIPNLRIRSSANPGGPGHQWVKAYFKIDEYPLGSMIFDAPDESGTKRLYVKSRLTDNKIGMANDPKYAARLNGLGSVQYVRALKDGDWNVIAGAFFPEFSADRHIIAPFEIPEHWSRIRMGDWGSAKPFAILWAAVSDGTLERIPRGALVIYREWYGWNGEANTGCQKTAQEVGEGIRKMEAGDTLADEVLDPSAFARDGGPSIAERMDLNWRRADNARVARGGAMGGWDQVRERLKGDENGAQLLIFSTCSHLIRTLPALQHDAHKAEDVDTNGEDHAPDALRYGCMSRPMIRDKPKGEPRRFETDLTLNELIKRAKNKRLAES
jgi:hypothetical protein